MRDLLRFLDRVAASLDVRAAVVERVLGGSGLDDDVVVARAACAAASGPASPLARTAMRDRETAQGRKFNVNDGYDFLTSVVECAREGGVRRAVVEALDALVQTSANYGQTYWLEFSPRNLATDAAGHLILLDVLFDREALQRARVAASQARARTQAYRW